MFKREKIHRFKSIRFKRWSRKNFAIFAGLKASISIGHLAKGIVDRLLPKTNVLEISQSVYAVLNSETKSIEELLSIEDTSIVMGGLIPIYTSCSSFEEGPITFSINRESRFFAYYNINKIIRSVSDFRCTHFV